MTTICTLYNHKGGVSKTTTTFNLGHALATSGYRVLLVDADPQCNLSELFLGAYLDKLDIQEIETGEASELPGTSILEALYPRLSGGTHNVDVSKINLINSPFNTNLSLLRGDIDLNMTEDDLSLAHQQRLGSQIHFKYTYVAIHDMLRRLGEHHEIDFILIDVGPSAGAITRSCFLSCDAFFVPVSPDRFNVQAIGSLSKIIDKWISEHLLIVNDFKRLGLNVSHGKPSFLGTITQNYKMRSGKPKKGYELWMRRIPEKVSMTLSPILQKYSDDKDILGICNSFECINAVSIPDFGSYATLMQECSKPVFSLSKDDSKLINDGISYGGIVWSDYEKRSTEWRELFQILEARLLEVRNK